MKRSNELMADQRKSWRDALSKRFEMARKRAGLTQAQVATRVGLTKQLISHWETARSEPTAYDLTTLSPAMGVDLHWLLTGVELSRDDRRQPATRRPATALGIQDRSCPMTVSFGGDAIIVWAELKDVQTAEKLIEALQTTKALLPKKPTGN
jgi:transcriptional regulator with XRE-family HTH domain